MLKCRHWVTVLSAQILLASAGCSIGNRSLSGSNRATTPDRMMAMAKTFERQGHLQQAKNAYLEVLAVQPNYPNARQDLETLIASEKTQIPSSLALRAGQSNQLTTRSNPTQEATTKANLQVLQSLQLNNVGSASDRLPSTPTLSSNVVSSNSKHVETDADNSIEKSVPELLSTANSLRPTSSNPAITPDSSPAEVVASGDDKEIVESDPKFLFFTKAVTSSQSLEPVSQEPTEFVEPLIDVTRFENVDIEDFFGPFRTHMVECLKANRQRFQSKLAELACDVRAENDVRSRAIFLLGSIGHDAIEAVPALRSQMHDVEDQFLKVDLSEAILKILPEDADAIDTLLKCLKDNNQNVRWVAAFALRNAVSPNTTFVIEPLRDVLNTDDLKLKRMVFLTLAEFGPAAAAVLPELEAALNSSDLATREVAKACLICIAPHRKITAEIEVTPHRIRVASIE